MGSSTTFSILIWINSSRAKNNAAELYARITVNSKRVNISLKKKIDINTTDNNQEISREDALKKKRLSVQRVQWSGRGSEVSF